MCLSVSLSALAFIERIGAHLLLLLLSFDFDFDFNINFNIQQPAESLCSSV